jgi:hypothetical protein
MILRLIRHKFINSILIKIFVSYYIELDPVNDQKTHQSFTIFGQNLYGIQRLKVSIFFVILSTKYSSDSIDSGSNDYQIMKKF